MIFRFFGLQGVALMLVVFVMGMVIGGGAVEYEALENKTANVTRVYLEESLYNATQNASTNILLLRNNCSGNCSRFVQGVINGAFTSTAGYIDVVGGTIPYGAGEGYDFGWWLRSKLGNRLFWLLMDALSTILPLLIISLYVAAFAWNLFMWGIRRVFWLIIGWWIARNPEKVKALTSWLSRYFGFLRPVWKPVYVVYVYITQVVPSFWETRFAELKKRLKKNVADRV